MMWLPKKLHYGIVNGCTVNTRNYNTKQTINSYVNEEKTDEVSTLINHQIISYKISMN